MTTKMTLALTAVISGICLATACNEASESSGTETAAPAATASYGGYETIEKYGEHLVIIGGCNDCHTPKKMGPAGPEPDMSLMLSGHPAQQPPPPLDQKEAAAKGLAATQTLTGWVGPWGFSYAANLTPDSTGLAGWTEAQFIKCLREGKYKGLDNTRPLLPPMPWQGMALMTDDELKAIFAYLKSIPAIKNAVPEAVIAMAPPK